MGVKIRKGEEELEFDTVTAAAKHIGVTKAAVCNALRRGRKCKGWEVSRKREYSEAQKYEFRPPTRAFDPPIKYKELFTRKPFSATGIWEKKNEIRNRD